MHIETTEISDVLLLRPQVFRDERGFFLESYNERALAAVGFNHHFVQDNHSHSRQNVLRGLHYQIRHAQGKLVRVVTGEIFDVAVDLRPHVPSFGKWMGRRLSSNNKEMLWIPPGFAHGFLVLSETADVLYKTTDYYSPEWERTIIWNDPNLAIDWPIRGTAILSQKDSTGKLLGEAEM